MLIADHDISENVFIIAEIGNNHEGDFDLAKEMIAAAGEAGVDAVKFQTIVPDRLVSATQTERVQQLSRFQFSYDQFSALADVATDNGVMFLSTPFDVESARFLDTLIPAFKISSPDNTFFPLLETVASTGKPILLSVGLCGREELLKTIGFLRKHCGVDDLAERLILLHCVSSYPTPPEEANLRAISALAEYAIPGYSDHTLGIEAAVASVSLGARVVEKHFTVDNNYSDFRDHQLAANPVDMAEMVRRIRLMESLLGQDGVNYSACEEAGRVAFRRSLVAASELPAGTILKLEHLDWVRPGGGIAPGDEKVVLGKKLERAKGKGEQILVEEVV